MSSPYSSLSKSKKVPLHRQPPFRPVMDIESIINADLERTASNITDSSVPEDCAELVDDVTSSVLQKKRANNMRNPWKSNTPVLSEKHGPSDMELMSTMMGRISQMQLRIQFQEKEITEKDEQIKSLQYKLKMAQSSPRSTVPESKLQALDRENEKLRKQVYDMEEFLADYGMMWVGNSDSDDSTDESEPVKLVKSKVWQPNNSLPEFKVDYDMILKNIRDLNILAGEGETKVHRTVGGAELKRPDPINLSLYANGILMFNGPFRPFTDDITRQCVQDLMDGYFPTELQKRYPDGVLFSVHDYRSSHYEQKTQKAFEGAGQILGGETKPSRLVPSKLDPSVRTTNQSHVRAVSNEQFLSKLPSTIIKKGKVIDIRQAVSDIIQGQSEELPCSISVVNTTVVDHLRKSAKGERAPSPGLEDQCTTLRIKHLDTTYVLVMKCTETVGDIRKHLCEHSPKLTGLVYDLATSYPRKVYSDASVTLEDAGLTPNALLHLQVRK